MGSCGLGLLHTHVYPRALGPGLNGIPGPAQPSLAKGRWGAHSGWVWGGSGAGGSCVSGSSLLWFFGKAGSLFESPLPRGAGWGLAALASLLGQVRPLGPTPHGASVWAWETVGPGEEGQMLAEGGAQPTPQLYVGPATATATVGCPEWSIQVIRLRRRPRRIPLCKSQREVPGRHHPRKSLPHGLSPPGCVWT